MLGKLFAVTIALLLDSAAQSRRMFCFEAPSIPNSICYKDAALLNEDQMKGSFQVGETVTYKCLDGYAISGSATVKCQSNGLWTTRPRCNLITTTTQKTTTTRTTTTRTTTPSPTCNGVPTIDNGACADTDPTSTYKNGATVICTCNAGYKLSNNGLAKCNNRKWTSVPACTLVSTCSLLTFDNGICKGASASDIYNVGERVNCACASGYRLVGGATSTCQSSGKWSSTPTCSRVMCFAAPSIANSECYRESSILSSSAMASSVFSPGESITYKCLEGYVLNGEDTITCKDDGSWPKLPTCVRVCSGVPNIANGVCDDNSIDGIYKANAAVTCSCNEGYKFAAGSSATAKCSSTGQWTSPTCTALPTTTTAPTCKGVPVIDNGACTVDGDDNSGVYKRGSRSTCRCNIGYQFPAAAPTATSVCSNAGEWGKVSVCSEIPKCTMLPSLENGACAVPDGSDLPVVTGSKVTCTCSEGYQVGNNVAQTAFDVTCKSKDTWSALSKCTAVKTTTIKTTTTRTTTTKTTTTTAPIIPCQSPNQIDGSGCDNCESPLTRSIVFTYGDTVRYTCRDGYTLVGNAIITCQRNGTWSTPPQCVAKSTTEKTTTVAAICLTPPTIEGAGCDNCAATVRAAIVYRPGDQIRYTCRTGYKVDVQTNGVITCLKNGTWSTTPQCILIDNNVAPSLAGNRYNNAVVKLQATTTTIWRNRGRGSAW